MKTKLSILIVVIVSAVAFAQTLIPVASPPTPAQQLADSIVQTLNDQLRQRIAVHKQVYDVLWNDTRATPAEILAALGTNAKTIFTVSQANKAHLTAIASLMGKTIDDLVPVKYQNPPVAITIHDDGTVTIDP